MAFYRHDEIYTLVDPRNSEVRYVGVTADGYLNRFKRHYRESNKERDQTYKARWIRTLTRLGIKPINRTHRKSATMAFMGRQRKILDRTLP